MSEVFDADIATLRKKINRTSDMRQNENIAALNRIVDNYSKLVAACKQLVSDYEQTNGECYYDNVTCAYHLAKDALI